MYPWTERWFSFVIWIVFLCWSIQLDSLWWWLFDQIAKQTLFCYLCLVQYLCFYTWCCPPRWRTWRHRELGRSSSASPCGCSRSGTPFPESEVNIVLTEENAFSLWHQNLISENGNITKWNIHKPKAIFWKESLQALNIFKSFIAVYEKFNIRMCLQMFWYCIEASEIVERWEDLHFAGLRIVICCVSQPYWKSWIKTYPSIFIAGRDNREKYHILQ